MKLSTFVIVLFFFCLQQEFLCTDVTGLNSRNMPDDEVELIVAMTKHYYIDGSYKSRSETVAQLRKFVAKMNNGTRMWTIIAGKLDDICAVMAVDARVDFSYMGTDFYISYVN